MFIGASASEAHEAWAMDPQKTVGYSMTGCTRSMFANRLSYFFDFKGRKLQHWRPFSRDHFPISYESKNVKRKNSDYWWIISVLVWKCVNHINYNQWGGRDYNKKGGGGSMGWGTMTYDIHQLLYRNWPWLMDEMPIG